MTVENYEYRTSSLFLRNQFFGNGSRKLPDIPKCVLSAEELDGLRLIGYDRAKSGNDEHFQRMVHFFLYDYKFEDIWTDPEKRLEILKKYRAVLTPDFSMYLELHPVMQLYNTFRNRWVGAYLAGHGLKVVPTVNWGDESTFDFCFEGIAKGSAVAVSTYMAQPHNNHKDQKEWFLTGYNEMLRCVEPSVVICYSEPFSEMQGNIVYVDYDLSSWKHDEDDLAKLHMEEPTEGIRIVKRTGYVVLEPFALDKGGGSAEGGEWMPSPNKPDDGRYLGDPDTVSSSRADTKGGGYDRQTKIGEDGRATMERHETDHGNPSRHSNPHDHEIDWSKGYPDPQPPINYPNGAPTFKYFKESIMSKVFGPNTPEENRFKTISDFKWCVLHGGEIEFCVGDRVFGVFSKLRRTPESPIQILVCETYIENSEQTELWCDTPDEALEYLIDGVRLREIITQVEVTDRTI